MAFRYKRRIAGTLTMNEPGYILGISAFYHDSAAALLKDGRIVAAAQEDRFTRKKHDYAFPAHAVRYCLDEAGIDHHVERHRHCTVPVSPVLKVSPHHQTKLFTW